MRGINVGIGTDTFPQDMIHEMRNATVLSKIMDEDFLSATSLDVFKCATVNGAKALGRDDIGRIRIGAKADIIVVKLDDLNLVPIRDPLKVLVNCGNGHNVTTTIVNGKVLMHGKKLIACEEDIVHEAQAAAKRVWKQSRVLDKLSPISLKTWQQK